MVKKLSVFEVFTPNDMPTHSYVDRQGLKLEEHLRDGLQMPKMVVSVSGPSKAGKSVLLHKVLDKDLIILVSGATISKAADVWDQAIQWMGGAETETETSGVSSAGTMSTSFKGTASAIVAKGELSGQLGGSTTSSSSTASTKRVGGFAGVVSEISGSDFILFIDDFHYIPRDVQPEVGRQLKAAAEKGVKICTASVPHRSDDVVRSNPELSGRIVGVNIDYWSNKDLETIGRLGFPKLNVNLNNSVIERLAAGAFGSPQLMQGLCLSLCLEKQIRQSLDLPAHVEVSESDLERSFERASGLSDYSSVVHGLHAGPKERGQERKQFDLIDGSRGDVYRVILMALCQDPPRLSFNYDDVLTRVSQVCIKDKPVGSSISQALSQMESPLSKNLSPNVPIIEWDENKLNILEPYFLFFMRSSQKLRNLAASHSLN